jgi:hypothetical protein
MLRPVTFDAAPVSARLFIFINQRIWLFLPSFFTPKKFQHHIKMDDWLIISGIHLYTRIKTDGHTNVYNTKEVGGSSQTFSDRIIPHAL